MLKEVDSLLKKAATAKGLLVILLSIFIGIFVWRNFNFLTEITFSIKKPTSTSASQTQKESTNSKSSSNPQLEFGKIILPPAPKELPAIMVFEIANPGTGETNNIRVSLDLGSSRALGYEILGAKIADPLQPILGTSMLTTIIEKIGPTEHAYLYVYCSQPSFSRITASSPDVHGSIEYKYSDINSSKDSENASDFKTFLYVILSIFIVVMGIYFTILLIQILDKYLWPKS